jgi:hypothetical protein
MNFINKQEFLDKNPSVIPEELDEYEMLCLKQWGEEKLTMTEYARLNVLYEKIFKVSK